MKLLLSPIALFVFASAAHDTAKLVYAPEEGTVLKRVFEAKAEYHRASARLTVDGEDQEFDGELPDYREGRSILRNLSMPSPGSKSSSSNSCRISISPSTFGPWGAGKRLAHSIASSRVFTWISV